MKLIFSFLLSVTIAFGSNTKEAFIWADDEDYAPYIYKDSNGTAKGIFKDIMIEAFHRMDIPLKYNLYAWKRAQKYVKIKKADGMITAPTKQRLTFLNPTQPLIELHQKVFTSKKNPKIQNIMSIKEISQFKDYKVVDYIGAGWVEERYTELDINWVPKTSNALLMLANQRADIYVMSEYIGFYSINSLIKKYPQYANNLKEIVVSQNSLGKIDFTLLIRKDSKFAYIIPIFNKTLVEMKKDGTYQNIVSKWQ